MSNVQALRFRQNALREAAPIVASDLQDAEVAVDAGISRVAAFAALLLDTRVNAKVSAVVGADAVDGVGKALASLFEGRRQFIDVHHQLAAARDSLRLPETDFGGLFEKPAMP